MIDIVIDEDYEPSTEGAEYLCSVVDAYTYESIGHIVIVLDYWSQITGSEGMWYCIEGNQYVPNEDKFSYLKSAIRELRDIYININERDWV